MNNDNPTFITIVQGSDRNVVLRVVQSDTGEPFDITGATEIEVDFPGQDDQDNPTVITKKLSTEGVAILNAGGGKFQAILGESDTGSMPVGEGLSFAVTITISGAKSIVNYQKALTVVAPSVG